MLCMTNHQREVFETPHSLRLVVMNPFVKCNEAKAMLVEVCKKLRPSLLLGGKLSRNWYRAVLEVIYLWGRLGIGLSVTLSTDEELQILS